MKVELSKTEIKTICKALDMAAEKCHYMLAEDYRYYTAANQLRVLRGALMYEALSEKLKTAGEEHE